MAGLVLTLAAREQVMVNGALLENGDRRGVLRVVTPDTYVLRLRDSLSPEDAQSPLGQLCLLLQRVLTGRDDWDAAASAVEAELTRLRIVAPAVEPDIPDEIFQRAQACLSAGEVQRAHGVLRTALRLQQQAAVRQQADDRQQVPRAVS